MNRTRQVAAACAAAILVLAVPTAAFGDDECSAELSVALKRQENSKLQFSVQVSTMERCATIEYDLVIEEQLANGQANRVRKPRLVNLDDGSLSEIVDHTLPHGHRMLSYEAKVVECKKCVLDP